MSSYKGLCPVCQQYITLHRDGTLIKHPQPDVEPSTLCEGTGQQPVDGG
jgi:hypothetical protein